MTQEILETTLMVLQAGGEHQRSGSDYQELWATPITILQGLLVGAGALGILMGLAVKAVAGANESRHQLSHRLISAAGTGLIIGLLADSIVNLAFSWM